MAPGRSLPSPAGTTLRRAGRIAGEPPKWAKRVRTSDRVVALVAAGGTGKTALAERVLASLPKRLKAGLFVWSFNENPQTEAFLKAACEYFLDEAPPEPGGQLVRLQRGLQADGLPHLLILDGLELVQATGTSGRLRGELEDPLMRRLLQWLCWFAARPGTRAKALITSRFPLTDLINWTNNGFRSHELEDLDPAAARFVLRKRGVTGDDMTLDALAESVHRHALTIDVLGLYLRRFGNGDPKKAPSFDGKVLMTGQKGEKKGEDLKNVLASYAAKLPNDERDLLTRLSLFPRGVTVEYLGFVVGASKEIAGALAGCDKPHLKVMLEGLRELGLVFHSDSSDERRTYSAHPFLRDFFRSLLGTTKPEQIYEAVRRNLALGLEERPSNKPTDPKDLDRYERLIEVTRLAGQTTAAYELYWEAVGGLRHLGWRIGDYERARRIAVSFSPTGSVDDLASELNKDQRANLASAWGMKRISSWVI